MEKEEAEQLTKEASDSAETERVVKERVVGREREGRTINQRADRQAKDKIKRGSTIDQRGSKWTRLRQNEW